MRTYKSKSQLLIIFLAVGFLIGIIYENVISIGNTVPTELFLKSNLQRYLQTEVVAEKYILYVIRERLLLLLILLFFSRMKWKKTFVTLCLFLLGFLTGVLFVMAVLQLGGKGIWLCLVGVIPQGIFYALTYSMLFAYWYRFPEKQWNRAKLIFVILTYSLGILTEGYINPILLKWCIKMF